MQVILSELIQGFSVALMQGLVLCIVQELLGATPRSALFEAELCEA